VGYFILSHPVFKQHNVSYTDVQKDVARTYRAD